jgi:hypothetical protein
MQQFCYLIRYDPALPCLHLTWIVAAAPADTTLYQNPRVDMILSHHNISPYGLP